MNEDLDEYGEISADPGAMEAAVFHSSKASPAILKHAILDKYLYPFAGKTGLLSAGGRVAFVDGYAGPGRYDDGSEGSGALVLRQAKEIAKIRTGRELVVHLVERDRPTFERLRVVTAAEGVGVDCTLHQAAFQDVSAAICESVRGLPALFYLDPCGLLVTLPEVVSLMNRPKGDAAPTELLLNFSATSLRRIAGHLTSANGIEATLRRMDDVCGGAWWRQTWRDHLPDRVAAEEAVVSGYMGRLAQAIHGAAWAVDVRRRPGLLPLYYLVFVTQHVDGFKVFGEASSKALEEWRRSLARIDADGSLMSIDGAWETEFEEAEKRLSEAWIHAIYLNLGRIIAEGHPFTVMDKYDEVYGEHVGEARQMHVRAAWSRAFDAGLVSNSPRGVKDVLGATIRPTRPS